VWEQCRCAWVKIKFYPSMPNDTIAVGAYNPVYIMKERDGIDFSASAAFPTANAILSEPNSRAVNRYRPFKIFQRSIRYPILNKYPSATTIHADNPTLNLWGQWHDITKPIGMVGDENAAHIYMQARSGPVSVTIGTLVVEAKFVVKGQLV